MCADELRCLLAQWFGVLCGAEYDGAGLPPIEVGAHLWGDWLGLPVVMMLWNSAPVLLSAPPTRAYPSGLGPMK